MQTQPPTAPRLSLCPPCVYTDSGRDQPSPLIEIPLVSHAEDGVPQAGAESGCQACQESGGCVHCSEVVNLRAWQLDHAPHEIGYAQCSWCAKVWLAVVPVPAPPALWCPDCNRATALFPVPVSTLPPVCEG